MIFQIENDGGNHGNDDDCYVLMSIQQCNAEKFSHLLLFQLGDLGLGLGDLPVDLGDLLEQVVLGAPHVVPLRRPVVRGRADRLHLRVVAGLLEEEN